MTAANRDFPHYSGHLGYQDDDSDDDDCNDYCSDDDESSLGSDDESYYSDDDEGGSLCEEEDADEFDSMEADGPSSTNRSVLDILLAAESHAPSANALLDDALESLE